MNKIRVNDMVQIVRGADRPQTEEARKQPSGKVIWVDRDNGLCKVEGKNLKWVHKKSRGPEEPGGREQVEAPLPLSSVMLFNEEEKRPERVGIKIEDGKRVRVFKKSGSAVDK